MDINKEFIEREKMERKAKDLVLASLIIVDSNLIKNNFINNDDKTKVINKMILARDIGWSFVVMNAANENASLSVMSKNDSEIWANESIERMEASTKEIMEAAIIGASLDEIETIKKNVLNARRDSRADYYSIDAVNGAVEEAKYVAISAIASSMIGVKKTWRNAGDDKVRKTHVEAGGQTVGYFDYFEVGGYYMQYPKDKTAPFKETANCRCGVEYSTRWSK